MVHGKKQLDFCGNLDHFTLVSGTVRVTVRRGQVIPCVSEIFYRIMVKWLWVL